MSTESTSTGSTSTQSTGTDATRVNGGAAPDLAALVARFDELQQRVEQLEAELAAAREHHGPVPIDTILAISAAVAAYLGKKATVRQIHYSHNDTWSRLGRSAVHASHTISRRMG